MSLSAAQVIERLGLQRHSTCGFAVETYRSRLHIPPEALPPEFAGSRALPGLASLGRAGGRRVHELSDRSNSQANEMPLLRGRRLSAGRQA